VTQSDRIMLSGLQFYGYHGVLAEETRLGQRFLVDVEIETDLRPAGTSDDVMNTINYVRVYEETRAIVEGEPCRLVETVAERIAEQILAGHAAARRVLVRVRKPDVPMRAALESVGVEIVRGRNA
jgi:dihydroneopterin aldolase